MIKSTYLRMEWCVHSFAYNTNHQRVLDVGSYDVNGTFKKLFSGSQFTYTGLDIEPGPNVDLVVSMPYQWDSIPTDCYDIVISGAVLEHVEFPWITFSEMARVVKPGGLICIVVPNGFREHRFPVDCWRFFTDGVIALARWTNLEILHAHTNAGPTDNDLDWFSLWGRAAETMLVARKSYSGLPIFLDFNSYVISVPDQRQYMGNFVSYDSLSIFKKMRLFIRTAHGILTRAIHSLLGIYSS